MDKIEFRIGQRVTVQYVDDWDIERGIQVGDTGTVAFLCNDGWPRIQFDRPLQNNLNLPDYCMIPHQLEVIL